MKTFNLVCKKINELNDAGMVSNSYWRIVKSSNEKEFPSGLAITSEKSARGKFYFEEDITLGPPFIDSNFERWLNSIDLDTYSELGSKPKLNITLYTNRRDGDSDTLKRYDIWPGIAIIEQYMDQSDPLGEYIIMFISLEIRNNSDSFYLVNEESNLSRIMRENNSSNDSNYIKLELLVKNTNEKIEELLQSVFYSDNAFVARMVRMENKINAIEKEKYIPKEDFNIITLFFRGGINNFILFITVMVLFNEIFTFGPLRSVKIFRIIENYFAPGSTPEQIIEDVDKQFNNMIE